MISTFRGVRTHLEFKVPSRLCLEWNNAFLTCFNPSECGISLSTSLSVSLFLSVTTYDATKNQFSPHVRYPQKILVRILLCRINIFGKKCICTFKMGKNIFVPTPLSSVYFKPCFQRKGLQFFSNL